MLLSIISKPSFHLYCFVFAFGRVSLLLFFMTIFCSSLQKVLIEHLFRRTSLSLEKSEERKREGEKEGGSKMKRVVLSLKVLVLTGTESPEKSNSLGL